MIHVLAAVIRRDGLFLVGRRPSQKRHGGLWEFPGGKVLEGESHPAALARELREELDLRLDRVGRELFRVRDPGSAYLIIFVEVSTRGHPIASEHAELAWCTEAELRDLTLAPADRRFVFEGLGPLEGD
jgi:8-oxo-dGTP pyrophosphatase MutT (NUDIX family)